MSKDKIDYGLVYTQFDIATSITYIYCTLLTGTTGTTDARDTTNG